MGAADRVVVATDADEIRGVCAAHGAECVMTRADHQSGTDRVAEVAAQPGFLGYDVVTNFQGDEPYLSAASVSGSIAQVMSQGFDIGTAAAEATPAILSNPNQVKVVVDDRGRALYFSRAPIPYLRDASDEGAVAHRDRLVRQHLGIYAFRREALMRVVSLPPHPLELVEKLEQLRALAAGLSIGVAPVAAVAGGGIDTEEDLALANARWAG